MNCSGLCKFIDIFSGIGFLAVLFPEPVGPTTLESGPNDLE